MLSLTNSPKLLKRYLKELEVKKAQFDLKKFKHKQGLKRKLSTVVSPNVKTKQAKIYEFLEISPKHIINETKLVKQDENLITRDFEYADSEQSSSTSLKKWCIKPVQNKNIKNKIKRKYKPVAAKEYIIEKIVDIAKLQNKPHFHVKWENYPDSDNTWEPIEHVADCVQFEQFISFKLEEQKLEIENVKQNIDKRIIDEKLFEEFNSISQIELITEIDKIDEAYFHACLLLMISKKSIAEFKIENKLVNFVLRASKLLPEFEKRQKQLKLLKEWETTLNKIETKCKLTVENIVDFEGPPTNFNYINKCLPGNDVIIPSDPPIGCECADGCNFRSNCCAKLSGVKFAYSVKKRLQISRGHPIFECNSKCKCRSDCNNRVVQQGPTGTFRIFKTSNDRGWGVRTIKPIFKGQFVCEYIGEIITSEEAEKRGTIYDAAGRTYLFDLDFNAENEENLYSIDAATYGNVSHFMNHSCDPNCAVWPCWTDCLDPNLPTIALFALRNIPANEEITFDYLSHHESDDKDSALSKNATKDGGMLCKCGTENCRKFVF